MLAHKSRIYKNKHQAMNDGNSAELTLPSSSIGHQIKELRERTPITTELPETLDRVIDTPADSHRLFDSAKQYWQESYDGNGILLVLNLLRTEPKGSEKYTLAIQYLKSVRKSGNILLSAFCLLDKNHLAPESHWKVVMNMGKVADFAQTQYFEKYASRLEQALQKYNPSETVGNFNPDSPQGVEKYISETIDQMQNIVKHATPDDVDALHMLRKNGTRQLMNLFQLTCLTHDQPDHRQMFAYLRSIDKSLGESHDTAVESSIKQGGNNSGIKMPVSLKTRQMVLEMVNFLGSQWHLDFDKTDEIPVDPYRESENTIKK
jgi:hypothetical protein